MKISPICNIFKSIILRGFLALKNERGFSLVELLISLIIISFITSLLAPVLTKKLKYQNAAVSSNSPSLDCTKFDLEGRCLICTKNSACTLCATQLKEEEGKFVYPPEGCDYKDCPSGCKKCSFEGCISCYEGYGFNLETKTCAKCASYEYSLGGTDGCKKCPINCTSCESENKCTACKELYNLNNGKCELGNCVQINNICVARFNAGDPGGLEIPTALVAIRTTVASNASASGKHTQAICWKGDNTKGCDSANGGYSGCNRTLCTWYAADKICKYHGWRLPADGEIPGFSAYSKGRGESGLQLCDDTPGYSSARCARANRCPGSQTGFCHPSHIWSSGGSGSTRHDHYLVDGLLGGPELNSASYAFSVRCVRDL